MSEDLHFPELFDDDGEEVKPGDEICVNGETTVAIKADDGHIALADEPEDGIIQSLSIDPCDVVETRDNEDNGNPAGDWEISSTGGQELLHNLDHRGEIIQALMSRDDCRAMLDDLSVRELLPHAELLSDEFIRANTDFPAFGDFWTALGVAVIPETVPLEELDRHVRRYSRFRDWKDFLCAAKEFYEGS